MPVKKPAKGPGLFERLRLAFRTQAYLSNPGAWLVEFFRGKETASGVTVNENTALEYPPFFSAIKVLSETIAMLPLNLYRRLERGKEKAVEHPLYSILHGNANEDMNSYDYKYVSAVHYFLYGNTYSEIVRNGAQEITELRILYPWRMKVKRINGAKTFWYNTDSETDKWIQIPKTKVLHIQNFSLTGDQGEPVIEYIKQSIGLGLATEEFGSRFFQNDGRPGGVLQHPGELSKPAADRMKDSWEKAHAGVGNSHKVAVLEEGTTFKEIATSPEEGQFLETRKYQISDVARFFRVQPHLIGDLEHATFTNIEHQSLEFVKYTMNPHFVRFEQSYSFQLLLPEERKALFFEFNADALLRGDITSRYAAYRTGREIGILSINDVREKENMNPIENGDDYNIPVNWGVVGQPNPVSQPGIPFTGAGDQPEVEKNSVEVRTIELRKKQKSIAKYRNIIANSYKKVLQKQMSTVLNIEVKELKDAIKTKYQRSKDDFTMWAERFYKEKMPDAIKSRVSHVFEALFDAISQSIANNELEIDINEGDYKRMLEKYIDRFVNKHIRISQKQLTAMFKDVLTENKNLEDEFNALMDNWETIRAQKTADNAVVDSSNVFSITIYRSNGIRYLYWVNTGKDSCPSCTNMDGKVVGIDSYFAGKGDTVGDMKQVRPLRHAPLHGGCDCQVVAGG